MCCVQTSSNQEKEEAEGKATSQCGVDIRRGNGDQPFAFQCKFRGVIGGLRDRLMPREKVERTVQQMLNRLKAVAESKDE